MSKRTLLLPLLGITLMSAGAVASPPPAAAVCVSCHGSDGQGAPNMAPMIAGLHPNYIAEQLDHFSSGKRQDPMMKSMADGLTDPAARAQVIEYFATRPSQSLAHPEKRGAEAAIYSQPRKLVYQGDWDRNIPACATCHGASGTGVAQFPRLAGQHADYLKKQLSAWKQGIRSGDHDAMMANIARQLTDDEINNLAYYFASLRY